MEKSSYRAYILVRYKLGKSVKEIHEELTLEYPNGPSYKHNAIEYRDRTVTHR